MRVLLVHAKNMSYKVTRKALKDAENIGEKVPGEYHGSNVLVVFVSVEDDDKSEPSFIKAVAQDILDVLVKVRAGSILLYPYAHLSSSLAPPPLALKVLSMLEEELRTSGVPVVRAPFGWYKEFNLHCYGHPLAELSREYKPTATRPVLEIKREHYVLTPTGEIYEPEEYLSRADKEFSILIEKEALGKELGEAENPVTKLCSKFGFEWEEFSDYGHMRYEPHAALIIDAVAEYAWRVARRLSIPVLRVKGTNMFDLALRPVYEHAELYGDRLYEVRTEKALVLRYAACHQQFAMLRDYVLSYRDLPLGMFEVADSYRLEQSGEVTLCFRLRKFYMPDLHVLVRDIKEAVKVSEEIQRIIHDEAGKLGREYYAVYNVTKDFWENHRDLLLELVKRDGKPVLVTLYPSGIYYWVVNVEYHIIDSIGRPREIATYQFDIGNAKRFGIKYIDSNGLEKYPVIIHTALIGSIERYIYMVFDTAVRDELRGKTPSIPTWLSPIQVRLIPLDPSSSHIDFAEKVADLLESHEIRVDIDDRREGLGKRIRDAAREWIPYIGVIGNREVSTGTINVTIRRTNDRVVLTPEELLKIVEEEISGYPRVSSTLPRYLSKRPRLVYLEKPVFVKSNARERVRGM
ncbi:MAG: threonine--tRNA ligase [Pyrodictiaceae archaeon]